MKEGKLLVQLKKNPKATLRHFNKARISSPITNSYANSWIRKLQG